MGGLGASMLSAGATSSVKLASAVAAGASASVTWTEKLELPLDDGVPERVPFACQGQPDGGSVPEVSNQA